MEKIVTVIISILLIFNIYYNDKGSSCNLEENKLLNDKIIEYTKSLLNLQALQASTVWGLSSNSLFTEINREGGVSLFGKDDNGKKLINNIQNTVIINAASSSAIIKTLDDSVAEKTKTCNSYFRISKIILFIALIMNLVEISILLHKRDKS